LEECDNILNGAGLRNIPAKTQSMHPFTNDMILKAAGELSAQKTSTLLALQQKIAEATLSEPKMLINTRHEQINQSSSKKAKMMGLPFDLDVTRFDLEKIEEKPQLKDAKLSQI
jgi:hypothetical protein